MSRYNEFIQKLESCPCGMSGWSTFENLCVEILEYLFNPCIKLHSKQPRTYSDVNRMDAIFSNRNITPSENHPIKNWYYLYKELQARLILFEFKNYDASEITHDEVNQTRNYLTEPMGKLAIMICSKKPVDKAHRQRNIVYTQEKKVILFLTKDDLREMLAIKERGEEPSDLIVDMVESFYIQHE
jgi:hypothetical protein